MDEIESIAAEVAAAFAAGMTAPAGSVRASIGPRCYTSRSFDAAGRPARIGDVRGCQDALARLGAAAGLGRKFVVDLTVTESRDWSISYSDALTSLPARIVFDPSYRYPNHPPERMPVPVAAINDRRPTDPTVLAEVQALVTEFTGHYIRLRGTPPKFPPGYSEAQILSFEDQLGVRLPEELRALYRTIYYDATQPSGLLGRFSLVPLEGVMQWRDDPTMRYRADGLFERDPVVFDAHPYRHVRRLSGNDWWVTFATDLGGNYASVDLDPAEHGTYGQVLSSGPEVAYVARSILDLMKTAITVLRDADPADESSDPWDAISDIGYMRPPRFDWRLDLADGALADLVAANPDPAGVQSVELYWASSIAFGDLAGLPHLRSIRAVDVRSVAEDIDLALPPGMAIEQVDIEARRFSPDRLASARSLAYLRLGHNLEPVAVAALAGLPNLVRLDLADARVADIPSIATFAALCVLTLNMRQWTELLATGWTPDRLAAAELAGSGVVESVAWLTAMRGPGGPPVRHRTIRGRV